MSALVEAGSFTLSACAEVLSLAWMEIAMFAVAALVYMLAVGGLPAPLSNTKKIKKVLDDTPKARKNEDRRAAPKSKQQPKSSSGAAAAHGARDELQRQASIIKAHAREHDLAAATSVFEQLRSSDLTLTPMIYNCYLDACVMCEDMEAAKAHFQMMKALEFVDVVGFNTMLKVYLSAGLTQQARDLVKEMTARGLQANKVTYNELLHAKVLAKDRRGLWSVVEEMKEAGVRANSVTCSILLKSLTAYSQPADV